MGKLALYGAIAGGAEGWQKNIEREQEAKAAEIDAQREERLAKLKHTQAMELEGVRQAGATERTGMEQEGATGRTEMTVTGQQEVQGMRDTAAMERQDDEQEWEEIQNQLDRESDERIAQIKAAASSAGARTSAQRFQAKVLKAGEQQLDADGNPIPGLTVETDTPAIYDQQEGNWYVQKGDKLFFPGDEPSAARRAPGQAIETLLENPNYAPQFYAKYNYLPRSYMLAMRLAGTQAPTE